MKKTVLWHYLSEWENSVDIGTELPKSLRAFNFCNIFIGKKKTYKIFPWNKKKVLSCKNTVFLVIMLFFLKFSTVAVQGANTELSCLSVSGCDMTSPIHCMDSQDLPGFTAHPPNFFMIAKFETISLISRKIPEQLPRFICFCSCSRKFVHSTNILRL